MVIIDFMLKAIFSAAPLCILIAWKRAMTCATNAETHFTWNIQSKTWFFHVSTCFCWNQSGFTQHLQRGNSSVYSINFFFVLKTFEIPLHTHKRHHFPKSRPVAVMEKSYFRLRWCSLIFVFLFTTYSFQITSKGKGANCAGQFIVTIWCMHVRGH